MTAGQEHSAVSPLQSGGGSQCLRSPGEEEPLPQAQMPDRASVHGSVDELGPQSKWGRKASGAVVTGTEGHRCFHIQP